MREKIILICSECLARNYETTQRVGASGSRFELKKYCPRCNKVTIHKESR
jgi:large subunit ribosomal protein L33